MGTAAGGNVKDLGDIDGMDFWDALSNDLESPRYELVHNIDKQAKYAAMRYGDYKLVQGHGHSGLDGWYGPSGRNETSEIKTQVMEEMWTSSPVFRIVNDLGLGLSLDD